ncbi:MAG: type II toxin-antitoxin system HicA family toxin [candidate division WOR-3 bacterium]|nr:type II toxin-antitoxin system HicA family toxin [candidate division WOR-3 bacterium]
MNRRRFLARLASGAVRNVGFDDFTGLVRAFGFALARKSGSHHIYTRPDIPQLVNLQDVNGQAKPYQIRQFLRLVEKYNLTMEEERE